MCRFVFQVGENRIALKWFVPVGKRLAGKGERRPFFGWFLSRKAGPAIPPWNSCRGLIRQHAHPHQKAIGSSLTNRRFDKITGGSAGRCPRLAKPGAALLPIYQRQRKLRFLERINRKMGNPGRVHPGLKSLSTNHLGTFWALAQASQSAICVVTARMALGARHKTSPTVANGCIHVPGRTRSPE